MGQTLSEPVTNKQTLKSYNNKMLAVSSSMQGWRITMEDAHVQLLNVPEDESAAFFAVFDGHGGSALAQHVSKTLPKKIFQHQCYKNGLIDEAIAKAHLELDYEMSYDHRLREDSSGTTSISVLIKDGKLYCANVGDSRAVASVGGEVVELSTDHKPSDPLEADRIAAAGGYVEFNRVNGNLALSRALGDYIYKKNAAKPPELQMVIAKPDMVVKDLTPDYEFLVLACDGIWDVMTNFEVIRFIRSRIANGINLESICEELLNTCLAPDCRMGGLGCDNMTILIVCFTNGKKYSTLSARCRQPMKQEDTDPDSIRPSTPINEL